MTSRAHSFKVTAPWNDAGSDSDASDSGKGPVLITGFDAKGAKLKNQTRAKARPLSIPSQPNEDWRAAAARKKGKVYVPRPEGVLIPAAAGAVDAINTEPVTGGLAHITKRDQGEDSQPEAVLEEVDAGTEQAATAAPLTEEQLALEALRSHTNGYEIDVIPSAADADAEKTSLKEDFLRRPDPPSLDDYARVPVGQFGAALLRGMGWKEGTPAARSARALEGGRTEAYVPESRPALLGLGAKEMDPSLAKGGKRQRTADTRFIPLKKRGDPASTSRESGRDKESGDKIHHRLIQDREDSRGSERSAREDERRRERLSERPREIRESKSEHYRSRPRDHHSKPRERSTPSSHIRREHHTADRRTDRNDDYGSRRERGHHDDRRSERDYHDDRRSDRSRESASHRDRARHDDRRDYDRRR